LGLEVWQCDNRASVSQPNRELKLEPNRVRTESREPRNLLDVPPAVAPGFLPAGDAGLTVLAAIRQFIPFVRQVFRRVREADIDRVAGSLSFTTLLGLVPLFTVAFAYVSRFPGFEKWVDALEPLLLKFLLPGSSSTVRQYLAEFTARSADLQGIGIAFVIYTAVMLVAQVEREINAVAGITDKRSYARRAIVYTLGFVAVPALIGAAIYVTRWAIERSMLGVPIDSEALPLLARSLSLGISTLVLTLVYALVPVRRVPWRAALAGGMLAAIAFDVAKSGFAFYIKHVPTYQIVYGAIAALPLFLVWVYVSWMIVLVGAAISATLAESGARR
jgi:membrane protein